MESCSAQLGLDMLWYPEHIMVEDTSWNSCDICVRETCYFCDTTNRAICHLAEAKRQMQVVTLEACSQPEALDLLTVR